MKNNKNKIALVGTNGVPARYGGFETLVHNLVLYSNKDSDFIVYCSGIRGSRPKYWHKARLYYIPFKANGWQSVLYDSISIVHSLFVSRRTIILGSSGTLILPLLFLFRKRFIFNPGGLDWKRDKWGIFAKGFLLFSESIGILFCDRIVADNMGIKKYIVERYGRRNISLIAYGTEHVQYQSVLESDRSKYSFLEKSYALSVARIQKDNNIELILDAFENLHNIPLVIVGNWHFDEYSKGLWQQYKKVDNIYLIEAIYDQRELDVIRSNCSYYIHGHSAGGTNPALIEAMKLGLNIYAFSNGFNQYTTNELCNYFSSVEDLHDLILNKAVSDAKRCVKLAEDLYSWKVVADKYCSI